MGLEIVLIHRILLYLDQPVQAAAMLATLLAASRGWSLAARALAAAGYAGGGHGDA